LVRVEAVKLVAGYSFDLRSNTLEARFVDNPDAGKQHHFRAYRLKGLPAEKVRVRAPLAGHSTNANGD
jgi:hypothetical protein